MARLVTSAVIVKSAVQRGNSFRIINHMKILLAGSYSSIGFVLTLCLLERGENKIRFDNHINYYDSALKEVRLAKRICASTFPAAKRISMYSKRTKRSEYSTWLPRPASCSIDNTLACINSNIVGFVHILEGYRHRSVEHREYASRKKPTN
jgi:UDP-glucuronate 4-epimerase